MAQKRLKRRFTPLKIRARGKVASLKWFDEWRKGAACRYCASGKPKGSNHRARVRREKNFKLKPLFSALLGANARGRAAAQNIGGKYANISNQN